MSDDDFPQTVPETGGDDGALHAGDDLASSVSGDAGQSSIDADRAAAMGDDVDTDTDPDTNSAAADEMAAGGDTGDRRLAEEA